LRVACPPRYWAEQMMAKIAVGDHTDQRPVAVQHRQMTDPRSVHS
jgi:hypothetical protein